MMSPKPSVLFLRLTFEFKRFKSYTMRKSLLPILSIFLSLPLVAQITITQADYGQAGDSLIVGNDNNPPAGLSVGGNGSQTWDFTSLSLSNINTLNFVNPANTASGSSFPNADLAIERAADTLFFQSSVSSFLLDGVSGSGFGVPIDVVANFSPNSTQIEFPASIGSTFIDTAVFDTIVDCASFGLSGTCDSARLRRTLIGTGTIDAHGSISTPGGTFESVRQYFREDNTDSIWIKIPFLGWIQFSDSVSVNHNYRWMANGEKWPVLSAVADAPSGNIMSAEFIIGAQVLAFADGVFGPSCNGGCNGSASVFAIGGLPPYTYSWSSGDNTAAVSGLCAGTYTVTIEDSDTGSYVLNVEINEPAALAITGSVQGSNTASDGAIDITVTGGTGAGSYDYSWTGPNEFTAVTADISGLAEGDYTVVVVDGNNCDTSRTFTVALTGIGSLSEAGFKAYPNPANAELNIVSSNVIQYFRVTDLLGNTVAVASPNTMNTMVSTANLSEGIYVMEVVTARGTFVNKITVAH